MTVRAIAPVVAVAETWTPSRRMQAAAAAERERVERELARVHAREAELTAELAAVQAAGLELEHQRSVLNQFVHESDPPRTPGRTARRLRAIPDPTAANANPPGTTALRGARIRETAVRVLAASAPPGAPVHYRDWFELLTAQGFMPAGKDPLATFLTQVGRSPVVQRTTSSGMYVLDLGFPNRARHHLAQLRGRLDELPHQSAGRTVEEIATAREMRERLVTEMHETERQLEEALRSLGDTPESARTDSSCPN
jgi:hypothetical protein